MKSRWSSFTKRITIASTTWAIYNAWAVPSEIEKWFLASAAYTDEDGAIRPQNERVHSGDAYLWKWHGFVNGSPESGRIIEANGHNTFSFTFAAGCVVEVLIRPQGNVKIVELAQSGISDDDLLKIYIGCGEGWTFYLANLKSILEGGIDLRNKNSKISGVVNA